MTFGNIFQEYHQNTLKNRRRTSTKLQFVWVVATSFICMGFVGNLKSILVRKQYEPKTSSFEEIVEKDMRVFIAKDLESVLELNSFNSPIDKRLLCQARKTEGIYTLK